MCFLLLWLSFELSNHNRQRAALMPMMVGMMVRMAAMMSSAEAHRLFGLFSKQVTLYLTGDLRVKRLTTEPGRRKRGQLLSSVAFILGRRRARLPRASHAAAGVSFASPVK